MWTTMASNTIRDPNPCKDCKRSHKRPGCHDTCEDRKAWRSKLDQVNANRMAYKKERGYR